MASGNDIRAGRAYVEIGTEDKPLDTGLAAAKAKTFAFGAALGGLGAAFGDILSRGVSTFTSWVSSVAESGREVFLLSQNLGITASQVQDIKKAGALMGLEFDASARGINKMRKFMELLKTTGQTTADIFESMGVKAPSASGMTDEQARQGFELSQAMKQMESAVKSVGRSLGSIVVPAFTAAYNLVTPLAKGVKQWLEVNGDLVRGKIALGAALVFVKFALGGIAKLMKLSFSPLTVALLAVDVLVYSFESLQNVIGSVGRALGSVMSALASGDMKAAWAIAVGEIKGLWLDFQIWFKNTFGFSLTGICNAFKIAWIETIAFLKTAWAAAQDFLKNTGERMAFDVNVARTQDQVRRGVISPDVGAATIAQLRGEERARQAASADGQALTSTLAGIEAERARARAAIDAGAGQPENLAADRDKNLAELDRLKAELEANRKNGAIRDVSAGLEGASRGSFQTAALFGVAGGSPTARLEEQGARQIDLLRIISDGIANLMPTVS